MKKGNRKIIFGLLGVFLLLVGMYVYHMNTLREGKFDKLANEYLSGSGRVMSPKVLRQQLNNLKESVERVRRQRQGASETDVTNLIDKIKELADENRIDVAKVLNDLNGIDKNATIKDKLNAVEDAINDMITEMNDRDAFSRILEEMGDFLKAFRESSLDNGERFVSGINQTDLENLVSEFRNYRINNPEQITDWLVANTTGSSSSRGPTPEQRETLLEKIKEVINEQSTGGGGVTGTTVEFGGGYGVVPPRQQPGKPPNEIGPPVDPYSHLDPILRTTTRTIVEAL